MRNPRLSLLLSTSLLVTASLAGQPADPCSAANYTSIQEALDRNPHRMIFVAAGDHAIAGAIRITSANAGLWGPGRIIQTEPQTATGVSLLPQAAGNTSPRPAMPEMGA